MTRPNASRDVRSRDYPLIVQSHLRWDFVWQRPQQLLSRFARSAPVLFIEEPVFLDDAAQNRLELTMPHSNVYRCVPKLIASFRGEYDKATEVVRDLVVSEIGSNGRLSGKFANAVQWFYTGMPAPAMLGAFNEIGVVYDCMDELSQFRNAHPDIARREKLLISNSDVVFTGGYKLYESKSRHHRNVHFFGCGVDVGHFGRARNPQTSIPADAQYRSPVAGYFGVIDERLDYDLIDCLSAEAPECTVLMVGPTAKVDPADLPQRKNIKWLGQRPYDELPRYVKAFDVCLMPFALNEATEYINPTKTLEYMAAGKPIVSTAVADVVRNFTPVVTVARSASEFVSMALAAAHEPDRALIEQGIQVASAASWDSIVSQMQRLVREAVSESSVLVPVASPKTAITGRVGGVAATVRPGTRVQAEA